jgi:hypothetical protein
MCCSPFPELIRATVQAERLWRVNSSVPPRSSSKPPTRHTSGFKLETNLSLFSYPGYRRHSGKEGAVPVSEDSSSLVACCMSARPEYLRQLAGKCAIKAAATKDSAARASFEAERKQLLRLAEQAERDERNRTASPMTGLRSSSMIGRWKK